jgi:hypothetical protein
MGLWASLSIILIALLGVIAWQRSEIIALNNDYVEMSVRYMSCNARVRNIMEDRDSDRIFEGFDLHNLDNLPDGWFLPPGGSGD